MFFSKNFQAADETAEPVTPVEKPADIDFIWGVKIPMRDGG